MQTSFLAQLCLFCVLLACVYEATGQMTFTDQWTKRKSGFLKPAEVPKSEQPESVSQSERSPFLAKNSQPNMCENRSVIQMLNELKVLQRAEDQIRKILNSCIERYNNQQ
ncbi:hypothetical protein WR25_24472 [Diploscapter pachys]|uniref:Uncharacterized protein n=1 Tax=Diploscapter pachys TaxID=2018661 RepID=A0A2A2KXR6_9BILA|nr:hypothetical protein WR25_24472 [Diploscapter pachys]